MTATLEFFDFLAYSKNIELNSLNLTVKLRGMAQKPYKILSSSFRALLVGSLSERVMGDASHH